jgi:hypothetical protein
MDENIVKSDFSGIFLSRKFCTKLQLIGGSIGTIWG